MDAAVVLAGTGYEQNALDGGGEAVRHLLIC